MNHGGCCFLDRGSLQTTFKYMAQGDNLWKDVCLLPQLSVLAATDTVTGVDLRSGGTAFQVRLLPLLLFFRFCFSFMHCC